MTKEELERQLLIEKIEARDEFEKMKKSSDLIGWIGLTLMIAFGALLGIGFIALIILVK